MRGKTNHDPKNAGTNQGSQTMDAGGGLDEDAGLAERRGAHQRRAEAQSPARAVPPGVLASTSGDRGIGVLLAGA